MSEPRWYADRSMGNWQGVVRGELIETEQQRERRHRAEMVVGLSALFALASEDRDWTSQDVERARQLKERLGASLTEACAAVVRREDLQ
jgi:cysteine sulfinate desulfinase/cysteine desulfurase-like protein